MPWLPLVPKDFPFLSGMLHTCASPDMPAVVQQPSRTDSSVQLHGRRYPYCADIIRQKSGLKNSKQKCCPLHEKRKHVLLNLSPPHPKRSYFHYWFQQCAATNLQKNVLLSWHTMENSYSDNHCIIFQQQGMVVNDRLSLASLLFPAIHLVMIVNFCSSVFSFPYFPYFWMPF